MPLVVDLQKADLWKRVAAWLLDVMLTCVLVVGIGVLLSWVLDYDGKMLQYENIYNSYIEQYELQDVDLNAPADEAEKERINQAAEAMYSDAKLTALRKQLSSYMVIIATFSVLLSMLVLEFAVPLWLKNGQTVGKKVFSLGLVRVDGVQVRPFQLFVRAVLGKYTIETMFPVYAAILGFFGGMPWAAVILLGGLALAQIICVAATKYNCALHDQMSGTAVVDISSQRIFKSSEELIEYTKRIHAERANRADY